MKHVGQIPAANVPKFLEKIQHLNKKANKLGCPEIEYEISEPKIVNFINEVTGINHKRQMVDISVKGEAPKYNGWELVGRIDHESYGNLVKSVPGKMIPKDYWEEPAHCDHCRKSRKRNATFVLQQESTQIFKRVGRNCISDFLGHQSPEHILAQCNFEFSIVNELEDEFWGWSESKYEFTIDPLSYLILITTIIDDLGWVSGAAAYGTMGGCSTANEAWDWLTGPNSEKFKYWQPSKPTLHQKAEAEAALSWAKALKPRNDYEQNLAIIAQADEINWKAKGLAGSIINAYRKNLEFKERVKNEQVEGIASDFVGEMNKRQEFTAKVTHSTGYETDYGWTQIYRFQDDEGNNMVWFSTGNSNLEVGKKYNFKGTVKAHKDHDLYGKQTIINRVSVLETVN